MRLIDLNTLLMELKKMESGYYASEFEEDNIMGLGVMMAIRKVKDAPTIEAEPVRHGEWVECGFRAKCSVCGGSGSIYDAPINPYKYCPYCGAKMDGGNNEQERTD